MNVHSARTERRSDPSVVQRPTLWNAFEFAVVAGLRAAQLTRGCTPRVPCAEKVAVTALMEVAAGKIVRDPTADVHAAMSADAGDVNLRSAL